jgi:ketosteroid isomerase-like protein
LVDRFTAAFRAKDVELIMSVFATEVVSFDLVPPLRCVGAEAFQKHWERTFASYSGPIAYDIHDLDVMVGGDIAVTHSLNCKRGTLTNGHASEQWLRWTTALRRFADSWLIVHEHVSVPMDPATGTALLDLRP